MQQSWCFAVAKAAQLGPVEWMPMQPWYFAVSEPTQLDPDDQVPVQTWWTWVGKRPGEWVASEDQVGSRQSFVKSESGMLADSIEEAVYLPPMLGCDSVNEGRQVFTR